MEKFLEKYEQHWYLSYEYNQYWYVSSIDSLSSIDIWYFMINIDIYHVWIYLALSVSLYLIYLFEKNKDKMCSMSIFSLIYMKLNSKLEYK